MCLWLDLLVQVHRSVLVVLYFHSAVPTVKVLHYHSWMKYLGGSCLTDSCSSFCPLAASSEGLSIAPEPSPAFAGMELSSIVIPHSSGSVAFLSASLFVLAIHQKTLLLYTLNSSMQL